jgi:N-acetylneuraminate lyase/4-hydroxy-tetrahydrodipicolinate synthase
MGLEGIITALVTPFTEDSKLNVDGLKRLVDFQLGNGVTSFFICGTYGLGPVMSVDERKKVTELVVESVGSKGKVIVHVGSLNIDDALELARHAEDVGAYAIASLPPYYYVFDDEAIINYFKRLVSRVKIPVYLYNNPARTGVRITSELLRKLADVGVTGVKDSSFDIVRFYEDLTVVDPSKFEFIMGTEALLLPAMVVGVKACISGLSNVFPELVVKLYKLVSEGDYVNAVKLHLEVIKVRKVLHLVPTIPAVFEVLRLRGIDVGIPKPPFRGLSSKEVELLRSELMRLGVLR